MEQKKDVEELKKELEKMKKKAEEYLNGWKRAKADYINFKKEQAEKEKELIQFANAGLILQFLPIYDHFKLALKHIPPEQKDSDWLKGFGQIKKQFADFLKEVGIEEIETVGQKFNPEFHEAMAKEKKKGVEKDVIIEEIKPGYKLHDKVLCPAKVKVGE